MPFRVTTSPEKEPISIGEARGCVDYLSKDRDDEIQALVRGAVGVIEGWEWRAILTQTITLYLDAFPSGDDERIYVPRPRLQEVTTLKYVDSEGVLQTLDPSWYAVDTLSEPGRIRPAYGKTWPVTRPMTDGAVQIVYKAGYGDDGASVPAETKLLVKFLVKHFWTNPSATTDMRVDELPVGIGAMLRPAHDARVLESV